MKRDGSNVLLSANLDKLVQEESKTNSRLDDVFRALDDNTLLIQNHQVVMKNNRKVSFADRLARKRGHSSGGGGESSKAKRPRNYMCLLNHLDRLNMILSTDNPM